MLGETLLARARARVRQVTPETAFGYLPWSLAFASLASLGLIALHVATQRRTDISQAALSYTLAALVPALVLACADAAPAMCRGGVGRPGLASWGLALNGGILLLFIAVYSAVWQTDWDAITGWRTYPYFNKRWLSALYAIAITTFLVLPLWIDRWRRGPVDRAVDASEPGPRRSRWWLVGLQIAALITAVWYLDGPPWNIATHHRAIDFHEQVHLGPLQAIAKGYLPYIGPASTQYGPGAQLAIYSYMRLTDQFNLVGFREAFLLVHLVSAIVLALLARAHAGPRAAWLVLLLALICSPLRLFAFGGDGSPGESYGWGNAARYLAALAVVPSAAVLLTRDVKHSRLSAVTLGVVWGVLAWFAQENLASVITGGSLLALLLVGASATTSRRLIQVTETIAGGFAVVWVPLLSWYAMHGQLQAFVSNYAILPRAVAAGFQNTWFNEGSSNPLARAFHYTPAVAIVIGVLTLWDVREWRVRLLNRDHIRLLSFVAVLLACFQGALYRSDSLHTLNVLIALPFVLVLAFRDLPSWIASTWTGRAAARLAIVAGAMWLFPLTPQLTAAYDWILFPPSMKFASHPAPPIRAADSGIAFARATAGLSDEATVAGAGTGAMRKFLEDASALHDLVGTRRTFVESAGPYFTGLLYFMADITPAPFLYDIETMMFNDRQQNAAWSYFQTRLPDIDCVITVSPDTFETRLFRSANPSARTYVRQVGEASLYVIMNGGEAP